LGIETALVVVPHPACRLDLQRNKASQHQGQDVKT
jgi:hypothetical protein